MQASVHLRGGTFGIPAALAAASLVALVAGLLGDGAVDIVAWAGLALPIIVATAFVYRSYQRHG